MGCSVVFPLGHKFVQSDLETLVDECAMLYLLAMCVIIVIGTVVYDRRWPECCWPGYFDLVGSSHQIFHVCVVGATLMIYGGIMEMMRIRHHHIQRGVSCVVY
jgi:adiponectin receptor